MKVIKITGKEYSPSELETNSKIIRKWLSIAQITKKDISGKYHIIDSTEMVEKEYDSCLKTLSEEQKAYYSNYISENWTETFPIMKDVSRFERVRPKDGVEFCVLI